MLERVFNNGNGSDIAPSVSSYDLVKYIKYDNGSASDTFKKGQELEVVKEVFDNAFLKKNVDVASISTLDIGCATGRYPSYFGELGCETYGYDISSEAVEISKFRTSSMDNVTIEQKNILATEMEGDKFDLLTCMMGTVNHFNHQDFEKFLKVANKTLRKNGLLIFSSWNSNSPYCSHLSFYSKSEIFELQKDNREKLDINKLLKTFGFSDCQTFPIAMLPNECYENWSSQHSYHELKQLEKVLKESVKHEFSQMTVYVAKK